MQAAPLASIRAAAGPPVGPPAGGGMRRPRATAAVWTILMAVLVGSVLLSETSPLAPHLGLDIAVGVVSVALVPLLSRWLVPVALLLSVLCAVSPTATPAATMAVLVVARWQRLPLALAVAGTGIAAHLVRGGWRPVSGLPYEWWAVIVCAVYAALAGWGMLLRANSALISSLRERAEQAEAEQGRRVAEARAAERTRIAREMHDVLAHRLSLLATYAGALAYRPDAPPEQLSRAAEVVRGGAHQALDELREVIGVLRDDDLPDLTAGSRPLPGLAALPVLAEESRAAGTPVELAGVLADAGWDSAAVPDALGRTVYRVVQEGLTNVRKHAPGEPARVRLTAGEGPAAGLDLVIASRLPAGPVSGPVPGTGTGLIGLAERVELAGGQLETGARGGEFVLRAWLPCPPVPPGRA
jgi:signal transduction histidine kinase